MKTLLDLTREYAKLHNAKTLAGGMLPPASERRWAELQEFYDRLMAHTGLPKMTTSRRYTADDIRREVTERARLRVRADMEIAILYQDDYYTGLAVNLSCGGVLFACDNFFDVDTQFLLFLANIGNGDGFLKVSGEVVWRTEFLEGEERELQHRMGIRFLDVSEKTGAQLDDFVVETLENQLLSLDPRTLDPNFVEKERLVL